MKKCVLAMREKGDGGGGVLEAHAIFFAKQAGDFSGSLPHLRLIS